MTTYGIPFILEDRTGDITNTEFDDLYDRMFFGISSPAPSSTSAGATIRIFELGARSSPRALAGSHFGRDPAVVLDFGGHGAASADAGTGLFVRQGVSMPIAAWLRGSKSSNKSPARVFRCSDDEDYTWSVTKAPEGLEWSCTTSRGYVAAQYSPRAPGEPAYASSSGSVLTIYEAYGHIATGECSFLMTDYARSLLTYTFHLELLSALTVVRYIHRYSARS